MSSSFRYIVTIEGIANSTGQAKYCYPDVPSYATDAYNAGLAEPPSGSSSRWEIERHKITVGTFRLAFRPGVGPIEFMATQPIPVTELAEPIDISETGWDHALTNTEAGITAPTTILYCDRETVQVSAAVGGNSTFTCTRGWGGSTAQTHNDLSDLFTSPPTLVGRLVTVYEVPGTATSSSEETVILRGYISGPPAAGLHWPTIECAERYERGQLNDSPQGYYWSSVGPADDRRAQLPGPTFDEVWQRPIGGPGTGGYWHLPDAKDCVVEGSYDSTTQAWTDTGRRIWGTLTADTEPEFMQQPAPLAFPILFADENYAYASFGYVPNGGSFTRSDNPAIIALNLLLSLDGTNHAGGATSYDLGDYTTTAGGLYPGFALGVPYAQVDVAAFELAAEVDLSGVHARRFFLGGNQSEALADVLYRLLAPWGFAAGTTRAGVWTLLRLGDVYPGDTLVTINSHHIQWSRINEVRMQTLARALDRVVLECKPSPTGESSALVTVEEVTGRLYYPRHTGAEERFRACPYDDADFATSTNDAAARSHLYNLIAGRIRLLAGQIAILRVPLNTTLFGDVDMGTPVSIHDVALRDPTTGQRLGASAAGLKGLVTHVDPEWRTRTALVTIALTSSLKVATMSPSAKVSSWNSTDKIATVGSHNVTRSTESTDARRFAVGDRVALVDAHFALRSDDGLTQTLPVVAAVTDTTLDLDIDFKDTGGSTVTPANGNWIVFASYDACTASQQADHAFDADNSPLGLGTNNAAPYRIGD